MRAAATILGLATACGFACGESIEPPMESAAPAPADNRSPIESLEDKLTLFFPMDESEGEERVDRVEQVTLVAWQRTGFAQYAVDSRGTTAVPAAVGHGQHIAGGEGYHFAMYTHPSLEHEAGSFTWAGWISVDAADGDNDVIGDQTWLAKWNAITDTGATPNHREYRIWHDHERSRLRFEVSADGLEGDDHSKIVTHSTPIERDRLYFIEAWHDAKKATVSLRVSTQSERGEATSEAWEHGVFAGDADLDVGAQNTCTDAHLQGVVDALGHWKRVLSDDESAALWNDGAGRELLL